MRGYSRPRSEAFGWFDAIDERNRDFNATARDAENVAIVRKRLKPSVGRTDDIDLRCGDHATGYAVTLSLHNDVVVLRYRSEPDLPKPYGITHVDDVVPVLELTCKECGRTLSRNAVWVLKATLRALIGNKTRVQLRPRRR